MPVTRSSPRYQLRILEAIAFMFQSIGILQVIAGGSLVEHVSYTQGQPIITDKDLDKVVLTFRTGTTGNMVRTGNTQIGDSGHQLTLSSILSITHDATHNRMTLRIDTTNLEVNQTEDIYFDLSVVQPDP